jgi:signal transduction histidine kinase
MPRQNTVDSGVDVTHSYDADVNQNVIPLGVRGGSTTAFYADKAVSARSEGADTRFREGTPRNFFQRLHKLTEKRDGVLDLRYRVQQARTSLRHERDAMSTRDGQLFQKLRVAVTNNDFTELGSLLNLFDDLQNSRDNVQPMEDDYDILEDRLSREEWELKEMERRLYPERGSTRPSTSSSKSTEHREESLQMKEYLSRKADAELLKEQLVEMLAERAQLLEDKETRARIGLDLDEDSRAILDDFDARHYILQQELEDIEEDVSRMQAALVDKDELFFSTNPFDADSQVTPGLDAIARFSQDLSSLRDANVVTMDTESLTRDPLLVSEYDYKNEFSWTNDCRTEGTISTPRYINGWMLHRLRRSRSEVRLFRSTDKFREVKVKLSKEEIKELVLKWWFKDQSVVDYEASRAAAASNFEPSIATDAGQSQNSIGPSNASDRPTLLEPILQAGEAQIPGSLSFPSEPPIHELSALRLDDRPKSQAISGE